MSSERKSCVSKNRNLSFFESCLLPDKDYIFTFRVTILKLLLTTRNPFDPLQFRVKRKIPN